MIIYYMEVAKEARWITEKQVLKDPVDTADLTDMLSLYFITFVFITINKPFNILTSVLKTFILFIWKFMGTKEVNVKSHLHLLSIYVTYGFS